MLTKLLRWLGFGLVGDVRALGERVARVEDRLGIERAIAGLTEGKGE